MYKMFFSIAGKVNVSIFGSINQDAADFLGLIYRNFDSKLKDPMFEIVVEITDVIPIIEKKIEFGRDAYCSENTLILKSGHFFIRTGNVIHIGIPTSVKRGRVPFKRSTVGRHISDEVLEPIIGLALLECGAAFLHASSYVESGKATVLMGWRGTGKTNAILRNIESRLVLSDDLSIIDGDGYVYAYNRPIRIYSYNIKLLKNEYIDKHKLNIRRWITPKWRPVHYLEIKPLLSTKKFKLKKLHYLNAPDSESLDLQAELIMDFEQIFFSGSKILLYKAGLFSKEHSIRNVLSRALRNISID